MRLFRTSVISIIAILLIATPIATAQETGDICKEEPCPVAVVGPKLMDMDGANHLLDNFTEVSDALNNMLSITACEKCFPNRTPAIIKIVNNMTWKAESNTDSALKLSSDVLQGDAVTVADFLSITNQIKAHLSSSIFTNDKTLNEVGLAEPAYLGYVERARRGEALSLCVEEGIVTDDPEYLTEVESSCSDNKDNDCDGLADCGFEGPKFTYEADPDCSC